VFVQEFSVESKTSKKSSLSTSWQELEAWYNSSKEFKNDFYEIELGYFFFAWNFNEGLIQSL
jgi:hypothetical protein